MRGIELRKETYLNMMKLSKNRNTHRITLTGWRWWQCKHWAEFSAKFGAKFRNSDVMLTAVPIHWLLSQFTLSCSIRRLYFWWFPLPRRWLFWISQKPNPIIVYHHVLATRKQHNLPNAELCEDRFAKTDASSQIQTHTQFVLLLVLLVYIVYYNSFNKIHYLNKTLYTLKLYRKNV